jgi:hypothetical protein
MTSTKVAISALLLALSASGALAQSWIGNGTPDESVRPSKVYYLPAEKPLRPDRYGRQPHAGDVPWAPF